MGALEKRTDSTICELPSVGEAVMLKIESCIVTYTIGECMLVIEAVL